MLFYITDPIENGDIFPEIYLDDKIVCYFLYKVEDFSIAFQFFDY